MGARSQGYLDVGSRRSRVDDAGAAHLWFLESMDRVNRAIGAGHDLEAMGGAVLDAMLEIFASDRAWLAYPCDPESSSWRPVVERTRAEFPGASALDADVPMDADVAAVFAAARARAGVLRLGPGADLDVPTGIARRFSIRSQMAMAIDPKVDHPYLLGLHQCTAPRVWTPAEQRLLQEIGRRLTDALATLIMVRSLRESERKLEAAQRIAGVGWWERDFATQRVTLSDEVCRVFGVEPVDLPQWQDRWLSLIHPDDRATAAAAAAAALNGGPRYDVEYRVVRPDGTVRVVHSQGDVLLDNAGRPLRQFGVLQDVTELRRTEHELRASESRFRKFVDHATDAFFVQDAQLAVVDVNRQACESLGYTREELIGLRPRDFDAGLDAAGIRNIQHRVAAGETVTFETLHRRKDGTVFPVEIRVREFDYADQRLHVALVRDIRERKRAERRDLAQHTVAQLLAAAQSVEDATPRLLEALCECLDWDTATLWLPDRDEVVLRCAQFWRRASLDVRAFEERTRASAFPPGVALPGIVWQTRAPRGVPDAAQVSFPRAVIATACGLRAAFAFPVVLGSEALGVIELTSREVRECDQELVDMMASLGSQIGQFIERKHAEEALRVAQAELTHMSRVMTMGELTATIAHEVNQPLVGMVTSASSCARWLAASPPNLDRAQRALDRIVQAGNRASAVIDRVRTLVKREPQRTEPVDIAGVVRDVVAMVRQELQRTHIALKTQLAEDLPAVPADRIQLQQVVLNLLLNAIEATREVQGRQRQIWIASRLDADRQVLVEVRDTGVGLGADARTRVFDTFYTTKQGGLGMGLSISRSIVEAHAGRMAAASNHPHGATFQFWLPLTDEGQGP